MKLRTVTALRYVQPLREGGSLPAVVDTEDGLFVMKFRGAGQGPRVLVAELIVGMIANELDLPVPEMALIDLQPVFGRSEPDPEIRDLLRRSHGLNFGSRYLDGAFNFAVGAAGDLIEPDLATRIVWLDAYTTNPDRTHRNPNLLVHDRRLWLIDHGSALYAHHDWARVDEPRIRTPFPNIKDHVLLTAARELEEVDEALAGRITDDALAAALDGLPDSLLEDQLDSDAPTPAAVRERYVRYLLRRLTGPREFVAEASRARTSALATPPQRLRIRR